MIRILIVASFLGSLLPRESFSSIISKGDMPAQKCSQGLPLKFQDGTFGAIKIFGKKIFTGSSTGCELEISMSGCDKRTSYSPWLES